MKVIFLDVDGVLNNKKSMIASKQGIHPPGQLGSVFTVDPEAVRLLRNLVEEHSLKIVVSSTWRRHPHALKTALTWCGWNDPPIIGDTDTNGPTRGEEIERWVKYSKDIEEYVIVDDDTFDIHQKDRLVNTKTMIGLEDHHILQIKQILKL